MTIALISVIIVAIATCVSVYNLKENQLKQMSKRLIEEEQKSRAHNYEVYDNHQSEKKMRDLIDIKLIAECDDEQSEQIYNQLIEAGFYFDFYKSCSLSERQTIIKKAVKYCKNGGNL